MAHGLHIAALPRQHTLRCCRGALWTRTWSMVWFAPVSRSSPGRSAVSSSSGTPAWLASTTAGSRLATAVPDDVTTQAGTLLAAARLGQVRSGRWRRSLSRSKQMWTVTLRAILASMSNSASPGMLVRNRPLQLPDLPRWRGRLATAEACQHAPPGFAVPQRPERKRALVDAHEHLCSWMLRCCQREWRRPGPCTALHWLKAWRSKQAAQALYRRAQATQCLKT